MSTDEEFCAFVAARAAGGGLDEPNNREPRQPQAAGPFARCRGSYRVNGRRKLARRSGQAASAASQPPWSSTADSSIA